MTEIKKDHDQIEIEEQIDALKGLIGKIGEQHDPMDTVKATVAAEFLVRRVREYCLMSLTRGGADGMDCTAA